MSKQYQIQWSKKRDVRISIRVNKLESTNTYIKLRIDKVTQEKHTTKQYNIFKSLYSYKTDKGDLFIFEKVSTYCSRLRVGVMVFNGTFNNISAISLRWVLLEDETGIPYKNTTDLPQVTDKLYHIMLYWLHLTWMEFELNILVWS